MEGKGLEASQPRALGSKLGIYGAVVVALCVAALVPLLAIAPSDRPSADDYSYSILTHSVALDSGGNIFAVLQAAVQTSADFYQNWQGLYTSAFCLALQPGIFGAELYQVGAYLVLASMIVPCLYLAYSIQRGVFHIRSRSWVPVGCILALFMIECLPAISEAVYWYNGAANYTPWTCACMLTAGLCITALTTANRRKRVRAIVIACILSFVISGSNYMPAFLNIMLMFGFACLGLRKRRLSMAAPLALAAIGFYISASAPGTAVRQAMFPDHPGPVSAVAHAAWESVVNVNLFVGISLVIALVLVTPFLVTWIQRGACEFSGKVLAAIAALGFLAATGLLSVPFYAMGGLGSNRIYNTAFELFAVSAFVLHGYGLGCAMRNGAFATAVGQAAEGMRKGAAVAMAVVGVGAVVFFGASTTGHGTSFTALKELANGSAAAYAAEYDAREQVLVQASKAGEPAEVGDFTVRPTTLFFSDVIGASDDWSSAIAQYYDVPGVTFAQSPHVENVEDGML